MLFHEIAHSIDYIGLFVYAIIISITPGPKNFFFLQSGMTRHFTFYLKILPGFVLGYFIMCMISATGIAIILTSNEYIFFSLKLVCSITLLDIAIKFTKIRFDQEGQSKISINNSLEAFLFQFVNPKSWIAAITAAVGFTNQSNHPFAIAFIFSIICGVIAVPCSMIWFFSGSFIKMSVQRKPYLNKIVGYSLFMLMIVAIVTIWVG
ncbi:MAG: LysE family transporter [Phycisphaerales bacterium]|nr:LysE family transporter [Phycisphaerales bacterium]